jgi:6-phosphogluconolactonase
VGAPPEVVVHRDATLLARAVAARLVTRLVDVQAARGSGSVVLTGGGIGIATLRALRESPAVDAIDWRRLDVFWGDERFVPAGDDDRNDKQARQALLDHVEVDPARVFPMAAADGPDGADPDAAAGRYADTLAERARADGAGPRAVPPFDVLLLGLGPEGHTASIFPESPAVYEERPVVAVRACPKPPPVRISLTLPAINEARQVWLLVAGEEKADAVHLALSGAGPTQIPAAGVSGRSRTLWLLDRGAASKLPAGLARPASP